jgi:dolichol-phosphate mannosyltransferase
MHNYFKESNLNGIVIIPTYNEYENISKIVPVVFEQDKSIHVLVVDDNSPDGTAGVVMEMMKKFKRLHLLQREKKNGLGRAYIAGFNWALDNGYDFVVEMDADFSHDPAELHLLTDAMNAGHDVVVGSRYIHGIRILNWDMKRFVMSYFGNVYARIATGVKIRDITGGYNLYTRKALEAINLAKITSNGYAFQIEMKSKAVFKKMSVVEVPIVFRDRFEGTSKMSGSIFKEALFKVWRFRFEKWFKTF